ncbi:MAG: nucleotidyl transferase AbiEii/AbiGii toxin family protein [Acidimicrobiales bacterium]
MGQATDVQLIESFHLLFLQVISARRQNWFVLKGGANLRYFFASLRYSNDIDLDFTGREGRMVQEAVDKVLEGRALTLLSRQAGIEVVELSSPKQTETTRRWKLDLARIGHRETAIRTKIEFSAREGGSDDIRLERVPDSVVTPYGHMAPTLLHYGQTAATEQKIAALALRSVTKARDLFDLDLLLRRLETQEPSKPSLRPDYASLAASKAHEISYASFRSEVLPFLDLDVVALYQPYDAWEHIRESVAERLEQIAKTGENPQ